LKACRGFLLKLFNHIYIRRQIPIFTGILLRYSVSSRCSKAKLDIPTRRRTAYTCALKAPLRASQLCSLDTSFPAALRHIDRAACVGGDQCEERLVGLARCLRRVTAALLYRACNSAADAEDGYICIVCIECAEDISSGGCKGCRGLRGAYIDVSRHFVPVTSSPETIC
jgi:hypothetical protein